MAKTKRRSCKGGRKSRRCRGGTNESFYNAYRIPFSASSEERGFGKHPQDTSHIAERYSLNPFSGIFKKLTPDPRTVDRALLAAEMAPFRARKAIGRTASALRASARGLKDSVLGLPSKFRNSRIGATAFNAVGLRSDYLDRSQLVPVDETIQRNYGLSENAADKVYARDERGFLYEAALENLTPDGYLPDLLNPLTAMFLPGRGPKPGQSWYITHRKRFH
jgi:hypothetical protein